MSYTAGEALILTQIRATSGFNANNSSRGIYNILNSGKAKSYAIVRGDSFVNSQSGLGSALGGNVQYERDWVTVVELWINLNNYGSSLSELYDRRQEIIERIDQYPRLEDTTNTIVDARVSQGGNVFELVTPGGKVWLRQDIQISWEENYNATLQE